MHEKVLRLKILQQRLLLAGAGLAAEGTTKGSLSHLGKLSPGGEVIIFLHSDKCHIGMALRVGQEGVFTRVLAVVQNLGLTALEVEKLRPKQGTLPRWDTQGPGLDLMLCCFLLEVLNNVCTRELWFSFCIVPINCGTKKASI